MKYFSTIGTVLLSLAIPFVALAQGLFNAGDTFATAVRSLVGLFNQIIPVLAGLAILFFFWGLIRYIYKAGDSKGRAAGRDAIIWGLVGLFIIFSLYGILNFLSYNFGLATPVPGTPMLPNPGL
jgi:hypothetical protein